MKNKNVTISKLEKNTIFVYKNVKANNSFTTDPSTILITTMITTELNRK